LQTSVVVSSTPAPCQTVFQCNPPRKPVCRRGSGVIAALPPNRIDEIRRPHILEIAGHEAATFLDVVRDLAPGVEDRPLASLDPREIITSFEGFP
jgi:hypothetical protein